MTRSLFLRLALGLALATAGCSIVNDPGQHMGGTPDGGEDAFTPNRIEGSALCARLVAIQCGQYFRCCGSPQAGFDVAMCMEAYLPACRDTIGPYLADGRTGYDPVAAAETVAEGERLSGACDVDVARWVATREGLFRAFAGTFTPGTDCTPTSGTDYAAFVSCVGLDHSCIPAIGERFLCSPRLAAGATCLLNGDCATGLACIRTVPIDPTSARCAARLPAGAVCRNSTDCESYTCHVPTGLMVGTCVDASNDQNIFCGVGD